MSKKRRKIAENWIATTENDRGLSLLHPACVVVCELRALWVREKLLEAIVEAVRDAGSYAPPYVRETLRALDKHDKDNPK